MTTRNWHSKVRKGLEKSLKKNSRPIGRLERVCKYLTLLGKEKQHGLVFSKAPHCTSHRWLWIGILGGGGSTDQPRLIRSEC